MAMAEGRSCLLEYSLAKEGAERSALYDQPGRLVQK